MKKTLYFLAAASLLISFACNNTDKELVGKMQDDVASVEAAAAGMEPTGRTLDELLVLLETAPETMKSDSAFLETQRKATAFAQKHQATMAEYGDLTARMKTLIADYSAGKIKTDEARKEYEVLGPALQGMSESFSMLSNLTDGLQTDYAKMKATWSAEAEEGKEQ